MNSGVSCSMIELNSSKSSITVDTAFRKYLPCRGALLVPYTHVRTRLASAESHNKTVPISTRKSRGATRLSYP